MPPFEIELAIILRSFDDDAHFAEALFFPEVSRYGDDAERLKRAIVRNCIPEKELTGLMTREGLKKRGIKLSWTERLVNYLVRQGFSTRLGARPLQRTIESKVVAPLASYLNREQPPRGAELNLDLDESDQVIITP